MKLDQLKDKYSPEEIEQFGTRSYDKLKKDGSFKSKDIVVWVKPLHDSVIELDEGEKLSDVKKWTSNFERETVYHHKVPWQSNKGIEYTAHEWCFKVLREGEMNLSRDELDRLIIANRKKCMFDHNRVPWVYVKDRIFKKGEDDQFIYLDIENRKVVETGLFPIEGIKSKNIEDWVKNYHGHEE